MEKLGGNNPGAKPSFIELAYTKEVMKAKFVKIYDGFDTVKNAQAFLISSIYNKDNLTVDELTNNVIRALQSLAIQNGGFSLSLNALTQKQANDFVKKYHLNGIYLTPAQVKELKGVYKGHFQAFKED